MYNKSDGIVLISFVLGKHWSYSSKVMPKGRSEHLQQMRRMWEKAVDKAYQLDRWDKSNVPTQPRLSYKSNLIKVLLYYCRHHLSWKHLDQPFWQVENQALAGQHEFQFSNHLLFSTRKSNLGKLNIVLRCVRIIFTHHFLLLLNKGSTIIQISVW